MLPKKIIFIHLFNDRSGSPKVLSQAITAFRKKNILTELITSSHKDGFLNNVADIRRTLFYKRSENRYITLFYYIISQFYLFFFCLRYWGQKVVFYVNTMMPTGAALSAKLMGKPVIYHVHETSIKPKLLKRLLRMVISLTAQKSIFVSNYLKETESFKDLDQVVVYNALDSAFLSSAIGIKRERDKTFNILMVCSLKIYKGLLEFLKIARNFSPNSGFKFHLVINATKDEIKSYFQRIIIPDNVIIHSRQSNMAQYYAQADLLLNLSRPDEWIETFGLTIIEAMCFGLPVIVPPIGGPAEIVRDDQEGYLISCYDTKKICDLIKHLAENDIEYARISDNARQRAKSFSQEIFEIKICNVLN
jgi:glycosyltransferase involved in cell wall biosynthesis